MIDSKIKKYLVLLAAAVLAGTGTRAVASTATISSTPKQTVKGWGCFPSYTRSDWGSTFTLTGRTAIQDAIYAMGITHIRVDVEPRLYVSGTTVSNIVLDTTAVTDLVNQITYARNHGVTQYIMSCWSPPAPWKDNGSIIGGHLIAADEPFYVAYYTKVLQTLNNNGVGLPVAISVQNEPDISTGYDSCVYNDTSADITLWTNVVKDMRSSFNANGMSGVTIFGVEATNTDNDTNMLGGDGLPTLGSDSTLNAAMGAYATHGYGECYWTGLKDGMAAHPKDAWVTEWSAISGNFTQTEIGWTIPTFAHFASNMVDLPFNYWTWWMGWGDGTGAPDNQHLLSGDTTPIYSKRYYVFQKLWTTVRPGWVVKTMTCDNGSFTTSNSSNVVYNGVGCDTFVDLVGFEPANGSTSAVLLINPTTSSVAMATNGLKGATYTAYQTDATHDMANVASGNVSGGSATVNLTANSVTIIVTAAGSGPPSAPTGLTATAGNAQVALSWTASSGATTYNALRSTVSGSGYASVATGISTTAYTNTGLTNGTTYYFVVTATNSAGTSGNSNQASATPTSGGTSGLVKINAAGPAVSPFAADVDFSGGLTATNWTGTIDTSAVTNPAPQAVYQSERYGAMTYTIGGLTANTTYTVRLHFCENYFTASGLRTFNVSINSVSKLSNFDIYATTGAIHKATCQQFNVAANSSGQEVIIFTNVTNNALINGIEVNAAASPPLAPTGLAATAGNAQVALTWNASTGATAYDLKRSTVNGSGYVTVSSPTVTNYTNTGLTNGTTYFFVVDAKNANGTSGNSNQASATPTAGGSGNTHGGTWACKAVMTTTPSYTNAWETVSVASNSTYVASFWIKGSGAVMLKVLNGNWGTEIAEVRGNATSTWQQFSLPAFSTGANTQLTYVLQDQYGVAGTAYLDDTFLGVSAGTNTLANPGFESGNVNWGPSGAFSIVQNP